MKNKRRNEAQLGDDVEKKEPKCGCEYEKREVGEYE